MKDLLKSIVKFAIEVFEYSPYLTGILSLLIVIYCLKYSLPKAYYRDEKSLYVYWNTLGLTVVIIFLFTAIFFIQLFRII